MNELKSYTEYAVSTPTADFVIGFDFNYGEDAVNVTVDDVPATEAGYTVVYLNETTIRLSPSVSSGVVRLQRETDIDQTDHAYRAGAKFIAQTMDENFEQLRHSQQEVRDGFVKLADDTYEIIDTLNEVGQSAQDAADAAEVAAELANDAAAQVSDKVPKSATLPTYLTVAAGVDPVTGVADGAYFNAHSSSDELYIDEYQNVGGVATPTGKSYLSALGVQQQEKSASTIKDASGKSQQEVNDKLASRFLSTFGAIPDDPTKAVQNAVALITASRTGAVVVDGFYYCDMTGISENFNTSLHWVADSIGGQIEFTGTISSSFKFGSVDHIIVKDVKLTSSVSSGTLMTCQNDTVVINLLKFDCEINTRIRIFSMFWSKTVNPKVQWYGVKRINFNGSSLENTATTFALLNCPSDYISINDVNIKNMSYNPFSLGIENAHAFSDDVKDLQKRLEVNRLVAINDDDFWATGGGGSYMSPVLFEGAFAEVKHCHVEGLKTSYNMAVYDFYVSAKEYINESNYWKNNLCFNSSKINNELVKAKGSPISTHRNNTYIVEEDFVRRHATDVQSQGWVTLFEKTHGNDTSKAVIENNTFDVFMLLGNSSSGSTKNIKLINNDMKFGVFASNLLNISNDRANINTYADAEVDFNGNTIKIGKIGTITRNGENYSTGALVRMSYNSGKDTYKRISCKNTVEIGNIESGVFTLFNGNLVAQELIIDQNITMNGATENYNLLNGLGFSSISVPLKSKTKARTESSLINNALSTGLNLQRSGEQVFDLTFPYKGLSTYISGPLVGTKTVIVELTGITNGNVYSAIYKLKFESDGVTYTAETDVDTKVPYPSGNVTYRPKVETINRFDIAMTGVQFALAATDTNRLRIRYEFSQAVIGSPIHLMSKITVL